MSDPIIYLNDMVEEPYHLDKPVILLCLQNAKKQDEIRQNLKDRFEVVSFRGAFTKQYFDLCIFGQDCFTQYQDQLIAYKKSKAPVEVPCLLLVDSEVKMDIPDSVWNLLDDVISISLPEPAFISRIACVLQSRFLSMKVKDKSDQLDLLKQAINATERGVLITDATREDNPIVFVNKGFENLTGYQEQEIIGRNCRFLQGDDRDQDALDKVRGLIEEGEQGTVVLRNYRKNGTLFWNELNIAPISDQDGRITHFVGIQNDVSELVETRRKLKSEKEFLVAVVNNMPNIFYMLDAELNFIFWNKNLEEEFGYSHSEIADKDPLDLFVEKDHGLIKEKIQEVFQTGTADTEVDVITKEGEPIPYYLNARKLQKDGEVYLIGSGINISERLEAEFRSEQREKLLNAIINQSESVIYVKDSDGRMRLVNDRYLELFEMNREEVIGKTDCELNGDGSTEKMNVNDKRVLDKGRTIEVEEEILLPAGIRYFFTVKYPLADVPGFENCLCGISTDITDRKETLHKLQKRIKEQACLYNIAKLNVRPRSVEELLSRAVTYLPDGWQYPEITEACIEFDGNCYYTEGYRESEWTMTNKQKKVQGKQLAIEVKYLEEKPTHFEGPFIKEERKLIDAVTDMLGSQIERITSLIKLEESEKRWEKLVENDPDLIQILEGTEIKFINNAGVKMYGADSKEELIGRDFLELVAFEDPDLARERIRKVMNGETVPTTVYKVRSEDDKVRHVEVQSVPIVYSEGRPAVQVVGKDVTEQVEYEERLQKSLQEKEVLLQEIHHRVKNNLAVISGLLQIQQMHTDDKQVEKVLGDSAMRVKSMGLIHEKLYQSSSLSEIDLKDYIEDLSLTIRKAMKFDENVSMQFDCDSITININQAVPCALLLNEVISNALEHAFPNGQKGKISIAIREEDNKVTVIVKDNGVGLPKGFVRERVRSMGFTIINTLVKQLDAKMNIENGQGTEISYSFEKRKQKGSSSSFC